MTIPSGPYIAQLYNPTSLPLFDTDLGVSKALVSSGGDLYYDSSALARFSDLSNYVETSAMQAAPTWAAIYSTTYDPQIAGVPWNNDSHLVFSNGPGIVSGENATSSAYFLLLFEDF